jgi:hypothetical protein
MRFWWRDLMEMDHLEELGQDGRKIFKRVSKKWGGVHGVD